MKLKLLALMGVAIVFAGACATAPTDTTTAEPAEEALPAAEEDDELFELVMSFSGLCICHAPLFVGIDEGIFEKHGLEVEFLNVDSGYQSHAVVGAGSAHVGDSIAGVAAGAAEEGAVLTAVTMAAGDPTGQVDGDEFLALVSREESGIQSLADLEGKKVGVPEFTIAHQWLYLALEDHGFDGNTHFELVNVPGPDLPTALQGGSVDAIASWEPLPLRALHTIEDSVLVYRGGGHQQFMFQRYFSPTFIAARPDIVQNFVTAWAEASQVARTNPDETVGSLVTRLEGLDEDIIWEVYGFLSLDPRVSKRTVDAAEEELEFARAVGNVTQDYDFLAHFDLRFLRRVEEEHPEFFSDLPPIPDELMLELD